MDYNALRVELIEAVCRLPAGRLDKAAQAFRSLSEATWQAAQAAAEATPGPQPSAHRDWPRAPLHRLSEQGTYLVTTGTYRKGHVFRAPDRLAQLETALLSLARKYGWHLEAWCVFSNHYHFVGSANSTPANLREFLSELHANTARDVNRLDGVLGRQVWHNFWDTQLTYEKSYLARLNYVHQNAVKHGLVRNANQYAWCSAAWFERTATPAQVKTIYGFKTDRLRVADEFEPLAISR